MKFKIAFMLALMFCAGVFNSCKEEDTGDHFSFDGKSYSLNGDNLYLTEIDSYSGHLIRYYFITDGTYTNEPGSNGHSFNDYEGATYLLRIQLGVPTGQEFEPGTYLMDPTWSDSELANTKLSYVYFSKQNASGYYHTTDGYGDFSVEVSGGLNSNETMSLKLNGKLGFSNPSPTGYNTKPVSGTLYFKGMVQNKRDM